MELEELKQIINNLSNEDLEEITEFCNSLLSSIEEEKERADKE